MEYESYKSFMLGNASTYSSATRKRLMQSFIQAGIALPGDGETFLENVIVLGKVDEKTQLTHCMEESGEAIKIVEEYEFTKAYKYSFVYGFEGEIKSETIEYLFLQKVFIPFDVRIPRIFDPIFEDDNKAASVINQGNEIKIKVSFPYIFYDSQEKRKTRKFVILVIIHTDTKLIEFRYDSAPSLDNAADYYFNKVCTVKYWLQMNLNIKYDASPMYIGIEYIKDNELLVKKDNIYIVGKNLEFGNGSSAELRVGKSDNMVLPLIGELKNILSDYSDEFKQVPGLKCIFENLVQEWEQNSQTPCLFLMWKEDDTEYCQVKIELKHLSKDGCRLFFYAKNRIDGEGMSRVVNYIGTRQAVTNSKALDGRDNA